MKTRVFAVCVVVFLFCGFAHADLRDGLVAYYPFNGNAHDESGNGNNGTVYGATLTTDRFGKSNSSYKFNGTTDYIDLSGTNILNFSTGGFSLVAWVNFTADISDKIIVSKHICGYQSGYFIGSWRNSFGFFLSSEQSRFATTEKYNDGNWHLFVGVYDGAVQYLYVDGVFKLSQAMVYKNTNNANIWIGGANGAGSCLVSGRFEGIIDDVRIYNRALSASEIQEIYRGQGTCSNDIITFTAGTPAKAADVNANFDALKCQNQALNSQLQALKAIVCKNEPTASVCQ
jgi:hypothetical protein